MVCFRAQLAEDCNGNAKIMGSNPVEDLEIVSGFIRYVINNIDCQFANLAKLMFKAWLYIKTLLLLKGHCTCHAVVASVQKAKTCLHNNGNPKLLLH